MTRALKYPLPRPMVVEIVRLDSGAVISSSGERRLHCRRAYECVDAAARRGWSALGCDACSAYEQQSAEQERQDLDGILAMLAEANRQYDAMSLEHIEENRTVKKTPRQSAWWEEDE